MPRHFLKLLDFTPAEIEHFLDVAAKLKAEKKAGVPHQVLQGKNIALIFEKTSTRTRCSNCSRRPPCSNSPQSSISGAR